MPWGRAGPVANAVLKSTTWNAGSTVRLCSPTSSTCTLWSPSRWTFPNVILVEEVVGHHEPLVVVRQVDGVRSRVLPEADDGDLLELLRIRDVEHHDLTGHDRCEDEASPTPRHRQQPRHAAAHRRVHVRRDVVSVSNACS